MQVQSMFAKPHNPEKRNRQKLERCASAGAHRPEHVCSLSPGRARELLAQSEKLLHDPGDIRRHLGYAPKLGDAASARRQQQGSLKATSQKPPASPWNPKSAGIRAFNRSKFHPFRTLLNPCQPFVLSFFFFGWAWGTKANPPPKKKVSGHGHASAKAQSTTLGTAPGCMAATAAQPNPPKPASRKKWSHHQTPGIKILRTQNHVKDFKGGYPLPPMAGIALTTLQLSELLLSLLMLVGRSSDFPMFAPNGL